MTNSSQSVSSKKKKSTSVSLSSGSPASGEAPEIIEKSTPDIEQNSSQTAEDAETIIPLENVESIIPLQSPENGEKKQSVVYWLFSPETKVGRFMRPFLRVVGSILGLFALGMLCTYLLLYLPVTKERDAAQKDLQSTSQLLETTRTDLANTQTILKNKLDEIEKANLRVYYLQVLVDVNRGRLALANKDGPEALQVLSDLKSSLAILSPVLKDIDPNAATILETRLDLINRELISDPMVARKDLEAFYSKLLEMEKVLFK